MSNWQRWALLAVCGSLGGLVLGCEHRERTVVVHHEEEPEPVIVEREAPPRVIVVEPRHERTVVIQRDEPDVVVVPAPPPPAIIVREPPPRVIIERHAPPPRGQIWINGHWSHEGGRFVWSKGHVEKARPGYKHVDPRWKKTGRGWELQGGYWKR